MTTISTLRPGLLVSVKSSVTGNVKYSKQDITPDHLTAEGTRKASWQTERVIEDPEEHARAVWARGRARTIIRGVCANSAFGLLCPEVSEDRLDRAIYDARKVVDEFNVGAKLTRVSLYVIAGRIAADDVEAVRAINSEVRDLLQDMEAGLANLDVKAVRAAADAAKNIGAMLSPDAAARIQVAIDAARACATRINKAGEQAAQEVDLRTIALITEARTAFLDLDQAGEVAMPVAEGRGIDFEPAASNVGGSRMPSVAFDV